MRRAGDGTRRVRRRAALTAAGCALAVAVLGGLSTDIGPWYASLRRPAWQPSDAWFGPVWTALYALCALSGTMAWRAAPTATARQTLLLAWALNAFLNVAWSLLFFRLRRPDWALLEVGLLWASIAALVVLSVRHRRAAGALLLPYLAWVSFAAVLNREIVRLNGPFGDP